MATPASRTLTPRAPEKGVFPLDHFGECKQDMSDYMTCLKSARGATERCRHLSKQYLECRMSKGLMAEEDLVKLGFKQGEASAAATQPVDRGAPTERRQEEKKGFVAGLRPLQGQLGASAQHRQR